MNSKEKSFAWYPTDTLSRSTKRAGKSTSVVVVNSWHGSNKSQIANSDLIFSVSRGLNNSF